MSLEAVVEIFGMIMLFVWMYLVWLALTWVKRRLIGRADRIRFEQEVQEVQYAQAVIDEADRRGRI